VLCRVQSAPAFSARFLFGFPEQFSLLLPSFFTTPDKGKWSFSSGFSPEPPFDFVLRLVLTRLPDVSRSMSFASLLSRTLSVFFPTPGRQMVSVSTVAGPRFLSFRLRGSPIPPNPRNCFPPIFAPLLIDGDQWLSQSPGVPWFVVLAHFPRPSSFFFDPSSLPLCTRTQSDPSAQFVVPSSISPSLVPPPCP